MKTIRITENLQCAIGKNAVENWQLLDDSKPEHIFFHLASFPSCYVILKCDSDPGVDIIKECAVLCKENTKYKNLKDVKVDYTTCNNVKKGDKVGEVYYSSNRKVNQIKI
jgi:predicted ribosome quality control (RQC) complex YloA/Tae2 family protein